MSWGIEIRDYAGEIMMRPGSRHPRNFRKTYIDTMVVYTTPGIVNFFSQSGMVNDGTWGVSVEASKIKIVSITTGGFNFYINDAWFGYYIPLTIYRV